MAGGDYLDLIEIACFHCGKAFAVCIHDYRGQRYCGPRCRQLGYRCHEREAGRRYQGTPIGRERHRRRQQDLRDRRVTDGAGFQGLVASATVSLAAAKPQGEAPGGRPQGRSQDTPTSGASDRQAGRESRSQSCIVCGCAGIVVLRITGDEPDGERVDRCSGS
jgi:hypothetical protein